MLDYSKDLVIESAQADCNKNYRAYSFMCDAQEIANNHATAIHFGYNDLIRSNCAWVLSRMKVRFVRSPKWQEAVRLSTWHKGLHGLFYLRDFEIVSPQDGSPLVEATSSWLILDLANRRMLRSDHVLGNAGASTVNSRNAIEEPCQKLLSPKDMLAVTTRSVKYSDVDFNGHTNNAKYVEWALDCIDAGTMSSREIEDYQINFNHESKIGDIVELFISLSSENQCFVEGKIENRSIFQMTIKFRQ